MNPVTKQSHELNLEFTIMISKSNKVKVKFGTDKNLTN